MTIDDTGKQCGNKKCWCHKFSKMDEAKEELTESIEKKGKVTQMHPIKNKIITFNFIKSIVCTFKGHIKLPRTKRTVCVMRDDIQIVATICLCDRCKKYVKM